MNFYRFHPEKKTWHTFIENPFIFLNTAVHPSFAALLIYLDMYNCLLFYSLPILQIKYDVDELYFTFILSE